ncbi:hypothetical protein ACQJBY_057828 [Aegilops geniculata]
MKLTLPFLRSISSSHILVKRFCMVLMKRLLLMLSTVLIVLFPCGEAIWHDCGVFSVMYMKHWTPGTPISNLFSSADIDNIRIKLANELCFSPFNSADKSFVTNFFGDSRTTQATFSLLGADQA